MQTEVYGSDNAFTHSKMVILVYCESGVILLQLTTYTENLSDLHSPMFTAQWWDLLCESFLLDGHICAQVWVILFCSPRSLRAMRKDRGDTFPAWETWGLWTHAREIPKSIVCKGSTTKLDLAQCPHTPRFLYQSLLFYGKDITSGHTGQ